MLQLCTFSRRHFVVSIETRISPRYMRQIRLRRCRTQILATWDAVALPSTDMALFSPSYGLVLPFLFLFAIPITLLAALTTTLAFSILLFRVTLVNIELAIAIIPNYLLGAKPTAQSHPSARSSTTRRRRRRGSSTMVSGSTTPTSTGAVPGLNPNANHMRDYEGVGGWRLGPPSDDDDLWTKINSRLELPAERGRRHQRSLTAGSIPGQKRVMSSEMMNTAWARTPPSVAFAGDSFFPQMPPSLGALKRSSSGVSSGSSKASSVLSMKQR